jgi:hypothetical protein
LRGSTQWRHIKMPEAGPRPAGTNPAENPTTMEPSNDSIPRGEMAIAKRIAARERKNAKFVNLAAPLKRVAIARDVLQWLAVGKLVPPPGSGSEYLSVPGMSVYESNQEGDRTIVNGGTCTACAIGAMFACAVERGENRGTLYVRAKEASGSAILGGNDQGAADIHRALSGFFSVEQLCLIEAAYEYVAVPRATKEAFETATDRLTCVDATWGAAISFGYDHRGTELGQKRERMEAIMQNIIDHGGTFVP